MNRPGTSLLAGIAALLGLALALGTVACGADVEPAVRDTAPSRASAGRSRASAAPDVVSVAPAAAPAARRAGHGDHHATGEATFEGMTSDWVEAQLAHHADDDARAAEERAEEEAHGHSHGGEVFEAWEVRNVVRHHFARVARRGGGVVQVRDDATGELLALAFGSCGTVVHALEHVGYFVPVDMRVLGEPGRRAVLDVWVAEHAGRLDVAGVRVQALRSRRGETWVTESRHARAVERAVVME